MKTVVIPPLGNLERTNIVVVANIKLFYLTMRFFKMKKYD